MLRRHPFMQEYAYPTRSDDRLFRAEYEHDRSADTCENCDRSMLQRRSPRADSNPRIHYGAVASGNQVMKHGATRDSLAKKDNVLCFEMEAAGLMDHFPCLIIRGICDYADSHKNKEWQHYAAATAAAYATELLEVIHPIPTLRTSTAGAGSGAGAPEMPAKSHQGRPPPLDANQKSDLMDSLWFEQLDSRQLTIKNAHAETCQWVLSKAEYLDWLDTSKLKRHYGFLWLKGKPGTGKSTMMKFLLRRARKAMHDKVILDFFFNARGEGLEKSTLGMYRSLLLQLLKSLPALQCVFDSLRLSSLRAARQQKWTVEILKDLFEQAVQNLGTSSVVCFIDALDECDEAQVRDMVNFFRRLGEYSVSNDLGFHVCFSSRHYPHITIHPVIELILEGQDGHNRDMANYIDTELNLGKSKLAKEIRTELQRKAAGVFIWVVLVIELLNKEYDGGRLHSLKKRLQEIPTDLHDLFRDILTRGNEDKEEMLLCIQWLLFARSPLQPRELYFAILSGINAEWDQVELSTEDMERFILNCSKGLAETTKSETPTVQFIHESIRDFFLQDDGLRTIWPDPNNLEGLSHERLKQCCVNYWNSGEFPGLDLTKPLPAASSTFRDSMANNFPFLKYALGNVFFHANNAASHGILQNDFMASFALERWIILRNTLEKYQVHRYAKSTRLLYILATIDAERLIEIGPRGLSCIEEKGEALRCPLLVAIVERSFKALRVFRTDLAMSLPPRNPTAFQHGFPNQVEHCYLDAVRSIEDERVSDTKQVEQRMRFGASSFGSHATKCTVSHLAEYGDAGLLALVLATGKLEADHRDARGRSPLSYAARVGVPGVVKVLLGTDQVNPNTRDNRGNTPLAWAAQEGHKRVVELLLDTGKVDPDLGDKQGTTPLAKAARNGYKDIVRRLLATGKVNLHLRDKNGRTPRSWAAAHGHQDMVKLLEEAEKVDPQ